MGYVFGRAAHKTGDFSEDGALFVKAIVVSIFETVNRVIVGHEERLFEEGDAVRPMEIVGGDIDAIGTTIFVGIGKGEH